MKRVILSMVAVAAVLLSGVSCSSSTSNITKGNKSKVDSLSYALGVNFVSGIQRQISDLPLNYEKLIEGVEQGALHSDDADKEAMVDIIRDYFMNKRAERQVAVNAARDSADSIAIANGADAAEVAAARRALPADDAMFSSVGERDSLSYAIGVDMGSNLATTQEPIQVYWVTKSMTDFTTEGAELLLNNVEAEAFLERYFGYTVPMRNHLASQEWLEKMAKKSGVKSTESGLLYKVVKMGDEGAMATQDEDQVTVIYTGKTRNGKVFDTSRFSDMSDELKARAKQYDPDNYGEDREVTFPLNRVIKGWTEGMKLVGKGGRIQLWIPSDLAYGAFGQGATIAPNEALFFDVELIDVVPAEMPTEEVE
ncbi:MAG: FKBP-type peptidyl-prolyl cis-trans isomerase [Rikenellaceae bacterium]